jgi:hypothetical protein
MKTSCPAPDLDRAGIRVAMLAVTILVALFVPRVRAVIPQAALDDPRYAMGYLDVTHYGADPTGVSDSTDAIQAAISDAGPVNTALTGADPRTNRKVVLLPPGTYKVRRTLYHYTYYAGTGALGDLTPATAIQGVVAADGTRPTIFLAPDATGFGNPTAPNAILSLRLFEKAGVTLHSAPFPEDPVNSPLPSSSRALPAGYDAEKSNDRFNSFVRDINLDCSGYAGAIGLHFSAAEGSYIANVKVIATGAYAGFFGLPGRAAGAANLEVVGGQYGLIVPTTPPTGNQGAGSVLAGVTMTNQAVSAFLVEDFAPLTVVGFSIEKANCPVVTVSSGFNLAGGTLSLIDGRITVTGAPGADPVIDNETKAKTIYLRNVSVSGSDNLVKSGGLPMVTGTGPWKLIQEYSYTNQQSPAGDPPYESGDTTFPTYSMIDGAISRTPEIVNIASDAAAPAADLVTRHCWGAGPFSEPPVYTGAVYEPSAIVVPAGASRATVQAAIETASTGNGRVFLSSGRYFLDGPLTLHSNTALIAPWQWNTLLSPAQSWIDEGGTAESPLIITDNDPEGRTYLGGFEVYLPSGSTDAAARFTALRWRVGRNSMTFNLAIRPGSGGSATLEQDLAWLRFNGGGGGRHYFFDGQQGYSTQNSLFKVGALEQTTQPIWFYGLGQDATSGGSGWGGAWVANSASNIRIYTFSREQRGPALVLNGCTNVALYGLGRFRDEPAAGGLFQVLGNSSQILFAVLAPQSFLYTGSDGGTKTTFNYLIRQHLTGEADDSGLRWPDHVSLYKLGTLNEAVMTHGLFPPAPGGLVAIPYSSSRIDLAWIDNSSNETGFEIDRANDSGFATGLVTQSAAANAETHASAGLAASTTYYYRVRATGSSGDSDYSASASATTQADNMPPSIFAPADMLIEASGPGGTTVSFTVTASDDIDGPVSVTASPSSGSSFPLGATIVNLTAADSAGNSSHASFTVTVRDTTAPVITSLSASPNVLQPPNHKMIPVTVTAVATDTADVAPVTQIILVSSNEPGTGTDWQVTGPLTLELRAERAGNADGRIYTITVESRDASGNATTHTVTVTVPHDSSPNTVPTLDPIADVTLDEDAGARTVNLTGIGDGDGDSQALTVAVLSSNPGLIPIPTVTYASPSATGNLIFMPVANAHGTATVTVTVRDSGGTKKGGVDTITRGFTVTVNAVNDAPSASAQSLSTNEDAPKLLQLSAADIDGDALTYSVLAGPAYGTLSGVAPNLTYTPVANYNGPDNFTFIVNDGTVASAPATISLTVISVNDAPVANAQSVTLDEDAAVSVILSGSDLEGDTLAYTVVSEPVHGTLSGVAPNLIYTPVADYNGPDSFTFRVNDGALYSAPGTVSMAVVSVNDTPSFTKGPDQTVSAGSGAKSVAGWASALSAGPANETAQTLSFLLSNDNSTLFSVQPAVSSNGTLTFTPVASLATAATATVTVRVQDNGGTFAGGTDTSAVQTFVITVSSGGGGGGNLVLNSGFEDALSAEWAQGSITSSFVRVAANARSGTAALQANGANAFAERIQTVPVTAEQIYTISGWLRVDSVSGGNGFAVAYKWLNSAGGQISQTYMNQTTTTGGSYVQKTATVAAPAGAVTLQVRCAIRTTTGTAYFDDLSITSP